MQDHTRTARAMFLAACVLSVTGFSRPPSKTAEPPRAFEIAVREAVVDIGYGAGAPSAAPIESRTTLSHFGRIDAPRGGKAGRDSDRAATVYTDSLLFRSEAPFRFVASLDRDTVQVSSAGDEPAAQMGGIETDEEMLRCLFEGPSIVIRFPSEYPGVWDMDHLKSECPGGLYRRLNLPVTMGPFILVPDENAVAGSRWQAIAKCPSVSGLGFFPQVRWTYTMTRPTSGTGGHTVEIVCDTTLAGLRATMPNGETVDIIADRIEVRGTLRSWPGLAFFYEGKIEIREEIRYVRPALDSGVLEKRCDAAITLAPR